MFKKIFLWSMCRKKARGEDPGPLFREKFARIQEEMKAADLKKQIDE